MTHAEEVVTYNGPGNDPDVWIGEQEFLKQMLYCSHTLRKYSKEWPKGNLRRKIRNS